MIRAKASGRCVVVYMELFLHILGFEVFEAYDNYRLWTIPKNVIPVGRNMVLGMNKFLGSKIIV